VSDEAAVIADQPGMSGAFPPITTHFAMLAGGYDVVLSDVWGVVHNGLNAFPQACDALARFRANGGQVVLITNAPRPNEAVRAQIDGFGVPRTAYDRIVSSGDVTRAVIKSRFGQTLYHLGPERDRPIFSGLDVIFAPLERADYVVCSGLENDEVETADDYRARLEQMLARKQLMLCGNPDVVVERGPRLIYCAGAIADLYAAMGGEVLYAGKPYRPIYDLALASGGGPPLNRVLAIGDSVRTDLTGANALGVDFLFVISRIHAGDAGAHDGAGAAALRGAFAEAQRMPKAVMRELVW
jgi:HAD superfamily hydrolase (TIGR01459 family)